jgi:transketolase
MQKAFLNALYDLAENDTNVFLLSADNGTEFDKWFKSDFPQQYLEFGIAECNMVGAAAGMAACGKIPFVHTAGVFLAYRAYEFVRNDVCFQNLNVKIIGFGSGLSNSTLGPSHHSTEDISVLSSLPNLTILSPCCPSETEKAIKEAYEIVGPVYIRIGLCGEPEIEQARLDFLKGKNNTILPGTDIAIFSTGTIITEVLGAADLLKNSDISARVINVNTLKPIDRNNIIKNSSTIKYMVSVEEHNIIGGLGSLIEGVIVQEQLDVKLIKIGLIDCFAKGYGTQLDLQKVNGLDRVGIFDTIIRQMKN